MAFDYSSQREEYVLLKVNLYEDRDADCPCQYINWEKILNFVP